MKSAERREEKSTYTRRGEEGSPDSPRWPSRRLTQGPTPALCFASNLSLSPVHCARVSSSSYCGISRTARPFRPSERAAIGRRRRASGEHRIRWVDAYESPGAARKQVRFSYILAHAESRRPNPHKSVALAVQERPFLARHSCAGGPAERTRPAGGRTVRRPFVRPRRMESRLA